MTKELGMLSGFKLYFALSFSNSFSAPVTLSSRSDNTGSRVFTLTYGTVSPSDVISDCKLINRVITNSLCVVNNFVLNYKKCLSLVGNIVFQNFNGFVLTYCGKAVSEKKFLAECTLY